MVSRAILTASAFVAFAAPAYAAAEPAQDSAAVEEPKKERLICKREADMGSKVADKVCRTAAEWKAVRTRDRRAFEERAND